MHNQLHLGTYNAHGDEPCRTVRQEIGWRRSCVPTPEAIASSSEHILRKEIKAGYRSPYLLELAKRVASGKLDLEAWRSSPLTTKELFEEMRGVKGVGPYAAGNIMRLVGRYDYLGLDSWVRSKYYELHRNGQHGEGLDHRAPLCTIRQMAWVVFLAGDDAVLAR